MTILYVTHSCVNYCYLGQHNCFIGSSLFVKHLLNSSQIQRSQDEAQQLQKKATRSEIRVVELLV